MRTLNREQAPELWDKFWNEMTQEWFKVELLQDYGGEDDSPSLRAWYNGDREKALELLKTDDDPEFTRECRSKISQGVKLLRFHVIKEPLTSYMEWEIEYYRLISQPLHGEQVFIVQLSKLGDIKLPPGDFMIYDNKRVSTNSYDTHGLLTRVDFYDETDSIGEFIQLKNELKKLALMLNEFKN